MKILGAFVLICGLGLTFSTSFNYWIWLSLKSSGANFSDADRAFVSDHGHPFFILILLLGILIAFGGLKLISLKRP